MKKLKKLKLHKEVIMNLNDYELRDLKGGTTPSSYPCITSVVASVTAVSQLLYSIAHDATHVNCPPPPPEPQFSDDVSVWVWLGYERVCELPEVVVYGYGLP